MSKSIMRSSGKTLQGSPQKGEIDAIVDLHRVDPQFSYICYIPRHIVEEKHLFVGHLRLSSNPREVSMSQGIRVGAYSLKCWILLLG